MCTVVLCAPQGCHGQLRKQITLELILRKVHSIMDKGAAVGNALSCENNGNCFPQSAQMAVRDAVCEVPSVGLWRNSAGSTSYIPMIYTITQPKDKVKRVSIPTNGRAPLPPTAEPISTLLVSETGTVNADIREFTN